MRKFIGLLIVLSILLLGAQTQAIERASAADSSSGQTTLYLPVVYRGGPVLKIGLVTDTAGIEDAAYNEAVWQGIQDAKTHLGVTAAYLESASQSDYIPNIHTFIDQGYDLIITVGYTMIDATLTSAKAHPWQKFSIVDATYDPIQANILSQTYAAEQSAFLCGYLAAGMTATGKVATYGGMNIPPVLQFMNGYYQGVMYYNDQKGASVQVLGWDPNTSSGEFTNDFGNIPAGKTMGEKLYGWGADIILPVAGPTGQGTAQAAQEQDGRWVIGVDSDWKIMYPTYSDVTLATAVKDARATTYAVIDLVYKGTFAGGNYVGKLSNQGVSLGTIDSAVPQALLDEIEQVKQKIIDGTIVVTP